MDDTAVCNMMLSALGTRSQIANMQEASPEAEACLLWYNQTRDELLRKVPWSWARFNRNLAVLKAAKGTPENPLGAGLTPPTGWAYTYAWPSDCIAARFIVPVINGAAGPAIPLTSAGGTFSAPTFGPTVKMIVSGDLDANGNAIKVLLVNQRLAELVYTRRVTDPNVWDTLFVAAMVGRLAEKCCLAVSGDKSLLKIAVQVGRQAETDAAGENGNEGIQQFNTGLPEHLQARGADYGYDGAYDVDY